MCSASNGLKEYFCATVSRLATLLAVVLCQWNSASRKLKLLYGRYFAERT